MYQLDFRLWVEKYKVKRRNGLLTVINLIRPSSDVWCSPTIFPVYGWDPSLGEHGQLIEKNKGKLRKDG